MRQIATYLAIVMLLLCGEASAQKMKERGCVREGNEFFNKKDYGKSIECYEEALKHDPANFEAKFNLGSALYHAERYEEAKNTLLPLLDDTSRSEIERGEVAYNLGNIEFAQKNYKEALSRYRMAMRYNPNDEDAKFNYAFTKRMLQQPPQQQNQDQNQDQNKDQNKEQNQDQPNGGQDKQDDKNEDSKENKDQQDKNNDQKQDNEDKNNNKDDKNNDQNKNDKDQNKDDKKNNDQNGQQPQNQDGGNNQQEGGKRPESGMSPEQQEALLQAVQAEEDKTQDKLEKEKVGVLIYRGKNW